MNCVTMNQFFVNERRLLKNGIRSELEQTADKTLFLELALRGYDLSKLRDEDTPAEIVKIG